MAFEYNGISRPVFLRPGTVYQFTTASGGGVVAPTVPSANPSFVADGNKLTFNWEKGDGARRIVVMKQGSAVTFNPADGSNYDAVAAFGTGNDLGDGQYVVYNGTQQSLIITNLQAAINYHLTVFEYNGTGSTIKYLRTDKLVIQQATASAPASGSTAISATAGANSVILNWQKGTGDARLVVVKEGGVVTGEPANLSKYPSSDVFRSGAQIATGEYAVYSATGNSVTVSGLDPQKTYHFSVFEYNGADAPVYNKVNVLRGQATTTGALPLTWVYFTVKEKQGRVDLQWGTTDEVHTAYFAIERSKGDGPFIELGKVQAANAPGNHDYVFTDNDAPAELVQYRIKQVDIDGKYTYSKVVSLNRSGNQSGIRLYPNPAIASFRVILPSGTGQAKLQIYDMSGKEVLRSKVNNNDMIPINQLPKGLYNIVVDDGLKKFTERLMKQ